jgi:hypothetical protein
MIIILENLRLLFVVAILFLFKYRIRSSQHGSCEHYSMSNIMITYQPFYKIKKRLPRKVLNASDSINYRFVEMS